MQASGLSNRATLCADSGTNTAIQHTLSGRHPAALLAARTPSCGHPPSSASSGTPGCSTPRPDTCCTCVHGQQAGSTASSVASQRGLQQGAIASRLMRRSAAVLTSRADKRKAWKRQLAGSPCSVPGICAQHALDRWMLVLPASRPRTPAAMFRLVPRVTSSRMDGTQRASAPPLALHPPPAAPAPAPARPLRAVAPLWVQPCHWQAHPGGMAVHL